MNLRNRTLGLVAALGLSLTAVLPAVAADDFDADAAVTVTLTDNGEFAVSITEASLNGNNPINWNAASAAQVINGAITIHYKDTKSYRPGFFVNMSATNFASQELTIPAFRPNGGQPYTIPAANFEITRNYDVQQGRWTSNSVANGGPAIGDIGATSNGEDDDSSSGPFANTDPLNGIKYHDWTGVVANSLDENPIVGFGFDGPGTASSSFDGSVQFLHTKLTIPAGQPADEYKSTLTVTVAPPGP